MSPLGLCGILWLLWVFIWVVFANFVLPTKKNEGLARLQHTIPTTLGLFSIFHTTGQVDDGLTLGLAYHSAAVAWIGVALTAAGHAFSVWARVHLGKYWSGTVALKQGHKIVDTGPYALVRHPIYTGLLTAALGSALAAGTWEAFLGVILLIGCYIVKWGREEKIMLKEFGPEYEAYRKKTRVIIPFVY